MKYTVLNSQQVEVARCTTLRDGGGGGEVQGSYYPDRTDRW